VDRLIPSLERALFVVGVAVLSFSYGFASYAWNWFPKSHLQRAWKQAQTLNDAPVSLRPHAFDRHGWRTVRPSEMQSGMTLVASSWQRGGTWKVGFKLFGRNGNLVHEWLRTKNDLFPENLNQRKDLDGQDIHGSLLLSGGDVVFNLPYVGMVRLNACGDVRWTLTEGNHHSISQDHEGAFWVPGVRSEPSARSDQYPDGFPGLDGKKVWLDRILKVSREGEVLRDINVLDVIYENDLERYFPKTLGGKRPTPEKLPVDITHLNDVEPLSPSQAQAYPLFEAGDLLVSLRSLSLVFVFDPETMKVRWHASEPFIYQHDPGFLGEGWIVVVDNNYELTPYNVPSKRGTMLGGNRIVGLRPHTHSTEVWFPTEHSDRIYTHVRGKWQQLGNGNLLLTEASAGRAIEVNPDGRLVWEWIHEPPDGGRVPSVSKVTRHDLTREEVASWACTPTELSARAPERSFVGGSGER